MIVIYFGLLCLLLFASCYVYFSEFPFVFFVIGLMCFRMRGLVLLN